MRTRIVMLAAVLALLAGCATANESYPSAFPGDGSLTAERRSCTEGGGVWHENLGICEVPTE